MTAAPRPREQFTAWALCPVCSVLDLHWLRAPRPHDPDAAPPAPAEPEATVLSTFGGSAFRVVHRVPVGPVLDEAEYEVIRTCRKCGHDWGQV